MKKSLMGLTLTVLCTGAMVVWGFAGGARAQDDLDQGVQKGAFELGASGGLAIPVGDYGDLAKLAGTGGINFGYYFSPRAVLGLDAAGYFFTVQDSAYKEVAEVSGIPDAEMNLKLYRLLTPYFKFLFKDDAFSPYLIGMTGLYMQTLKYTAQGIGGSPQSITNTFSHGYVGVAAGAGLQWVTSGNVILIVDAKYHTAMRSGSIPLTFFDVRVGAAFEL